MRRKEIADDVEGLHNEMEHSETTIEGLSQQKKNGKKWTAFGRGKGG